MNRYFNIKIPRKQGIPNVSDIKRDSQCFLDKTDVFFQ